MVQGAAVRATQRAVAYLFIVPESQHVGGPDTVDQAVQHKTYDLGTRAVDQVPPGEIEHIHMVVPVCPDSLEGETDGMGDVFFLFFGLNVQRRQMALLSCGVPSLEVAVAESLAALVDRETDSEFNVGGDCLGHG